MSRIRRSTIQRFWDRVRIQENGCWLWVGSTDEKGYGLTRVDNDFGLQETMRAHRVSYLAFRDEIPEGMSVLHYCDTPRCVNPEHLFCGFQAGNMADMRKKGRDNSFGHKGPKGSTTKSTEQTTVEGQPSVVAAEAERAAAA